MQVAAVVVATQVEVDPADQVDQVVVPMAQ
jgi:hypothetical protein